MGRGAWQTAVHGVARVRQDLATKPLQTFPCALTIQLSLPLFLDVPFSECYIFGVIQYVAFAD